MQIEKERTFCRYQTPILQSEIVNKIKMLSSSRWIFLLLINKLIDYTGNTHLLK